MNNVSSSNTIKPLTLCVVICTRDRADDVRDCLKSLDSQSRLPDRVIIVSGSDESVPDDIHSHFPRLPLTVVASYEHNISVARNLGISLSHEDLVAFIDDDAIAYQDWVTQYVQYMSGHSECSIAGGLVYDSRFVPMRVEFQYGSITRLGRQTPVHDVHARLRSTDYLSVKGCNFVIRRKELQVKGLAFDPFFRFAFDESDLVMAVVDAGGCIGYCHEAIVDHKHTPGHYRQDGPLDQDWHVQFASHTQFMLKHTPSYWHGYAMCLLVFRCIKLSLNCVKEILKGKARVQESVGYIQSAIIGIREAVQHSKT